MSLRLNSGSIISWGDIKTPNEELINIKAIGTGWYHSFAINQAGRIIGWGDNGRGQATPPSGNKFIAVTGGFEHSIANMTILSVGLLLPHSEAISILGFANNLVPVTIGNMIGGSIFIGYTYWFISKDK